MNINSTKKRKHNEEEDCNSNKGSDNDYHPGVDNFSQLEPSPKAGIQLEEEFNSFCKDETDHTYQTEDPSNYAETLTRKYILTLQEVDIRETNNKELLYDNSISIYDRL
ncbi:uncharacterized protein RHIMIDRAFT_249684 [Rhizopus microsporus ATCC 52813]|uniref:Uncharacterized protein n=1 Tax=Rhizopus microsporus ATCC 52813 TaxID=1340429 RepID=A0A2G4T167_RHIZD|nr:uncharacterized protein RHIMIDRAFT_249684 [Rhizopus microsporus ATCC 52813]PHZ14762.1 hypothetical protein RHIMIDRAFT_249684 [Rhizopus microsporus ATCC 52813]